ncbi:MAG: NUDIX domain-containing protein, partial [Patescibacteria group bacterium]
HLFLVRPDNHILLLRRYNTGYEDGNYSVVAGHLEGGEPVRSAAAREAKEEAGIDIKPHHLSIAHVMHRVTDHEKIDWFFVADQWRGEVINGEPAKCDDLSWFPLDHLPENTIPYIKSAIESWQGGVVFSEFGWEKVYAGSTR